MAVQRRFNSSRSKQVRRNTAGSKQGSGDDTHMLVGSTGGGSTEYLYRSLIQFSHNWTGMARVVKIELALRNELSSTHFTVGNKARVRVQRLTQSFTDGTAAENHWTSGDYAWPSSTGGVEFDLPINPATGKPFDNAWVFIDVTTLLKAIVPKGIVMADGTPGGGSTDYGLLVRSPGNEKSDAQRMIFFSFDRSGSTNDPYLLVTYDPPNRAPNAPALLTPALTDVSLGDSFDGQHDDPDLDPMAARNIEVWLKDQTGDAGKSAQWTLPASLQSAGSDETATGRFSVPLSLAIGALKLQTDYEWRAQTKDPGGLWGAFSAVRALRITSSAPSVLATVLAPLAEMASGRFGGTYSDPENDPLAEFQLQMRSVASWVDASFSDPALIVWDTGNATPAADEVATKVISRAYGGSPLAAGTYTYRIRVQDSTGAWSTWSYADFVLTANYDPDLGSAELTTQVARNAPVRVALYLMGTNRGPGALIGYVDDPMDLGASAYLNGGGELYFSLPALHPYCPYIEPHQTHYAVEQYHGDRYRTLFAGIITDFDADGDSAVFYGADYLGLLQTAVDERYNPANSEEAANGSGGGGSKYTDKTIDYIIRDQLTYHKNLADSPVKFITIGSLSVLAERATIYATYAEALPFITGLIDSHKQGTGRESRFYARPTNAAFTAWEWALVDNWGKDRPNIELEWGGLLNDFRVIALGDFATRVLAVGQKRGEVKVYRAVGKGGLNESQWGRRAKTAFFADIIDQNDLQRRANENAMVLSKIGKRMALALRADMLTPFDGWDVGDNIKVTIARGVVDTSQYGSEGYWTILGVEWRYHPDGHTEMTLSILPKKTATPPDPDLIPSINPGVPDEWQVGYGVPGNFGDPPGSDTMTFFPPSDEPVIAKHYEDLNTGCVYELDEDPASPTYGTYLEVFCPPTGGGGGGPADTTPPDAPIIKSTVSTSTGQEDGTSITNIAAEVGYASPPAGLDDLDQITLQTTRYSLPGVEPPQPDWTLAAVSQTASADRTGTLDTAVLQPTALAATGYWIRASAVDLSGNRSGWSPILQITSASDTTGPPQPAGIVVQSGMSTIGVRWDPIDVPDLDYVEVQWRVAPSGNWTAVQVHGTMTVITGLANETTYDLRVRSVDTSGNVLYDTGADDPDGNPIFATAKAIEQPEYGWVLTDQATPTTLSGDDLVWDSAMIGDIFAGEINADWITAGTLKVGGAPDSAAAIEVYDSSGNLIGRWSTAGIEVFDPTHAGYKLVITNAGLVIYDLTDPANPITAVSMTPLGIDAASITFGSARGGHNLILNSSFEQGRFGSSVVINNVWTVAADWNATRVGADVNVTTGANDLTMTVI